MPRELEDYMTALPSNAIEYADYGLAYLLFRSRGYNFSPKSISSAPQLSYTTFAIYNLVH